MQLSSDDADSDLNELDPEEQRRSLSTGKSGHKLKRTLGFWDGVSILIIIIIGSGIFSSPGETLERSGSPGGALLAWSLSGNLLLYVVLY